jgi:hypothetical protein
MQNHIRTHFKNCDIRLGEACTSPLLVQVTLIIRGGRVPANRHKKQKRVKRETFNDRHFDVKLAPEFFDAKLIICITFPDKSGESSTQITGFKIWPWIGY